MKNLDIALILVILVGFTVYVSVTTNQISSLRLQIASLVKENEKCMVSAAYDKKLQDSISEIISKRCGDIRGPQPIRECVK